MRSITTEQLWDRLAASGLVTGKNAPLSDQHSPWFVRVMLGFAGWIGALFLLGFVGVSLQFIFRSSEASLIAGVVVCAAAAYIFRTLAGKRLCRPVRTGDELCGTGDVYIWSDGHIQGGEWRQLPCYNGL